MERNIVNLLERFAFAALSLYPEYRAELGEVRKLIRQGKLEDAEAVIQSSLPGSVALPLYGALAGAKAVLQPAKAA